MSAIKLIPQLLCWAAILLVLLRGFSGRRSAVLAAATAGLAGGITGGFLVLGAFPGDYAFETIRNVVGASFLVLWGASVAALYRNTGRELPTSKVDRLVNSTPFALISSCAAGVMAGAISACRLTVAAPGTAPLVTFAAAAALLALVVFLAERRLPETISFPKAGLFAAVVALLLYSCAFLLRLDLFAPLTMKVMKFCHDFVHQFFESMLIPDHLFFSPWVWNYIGFLFGKEVGLYGGTVIWLTPALLVLIAVSCERLPSVGHIRQGAQRRRMIADALRERRLRLIVPLCSLVVFAGALYQSRFPTVEYWDPKPVPVTASAAGEIVIPRKGDIDLEDGKLHKYLFKKGDKEVRFFILMTPDGKLTTDLDACAICKPDGYGQAEGTVICYYCKTLIPLDTVGKPGGCNPVPMQATVRDDGVHIDSVALVNTWNSTVQSTTKVKEGGK